MPRNIDVVLQAMLDNCELANTDKKNIDNLLKVNEMYYTTVHAAFMQSRHAKLHKQKTKNQIFDRCYKTKEQRAEDAEKLKERTDKARATRAAKTLGTRSHQRRTARRKVAS